MGHQIKVLHIVAPARFGGLERVVHALAAGRHRAGRPTHVLVVRDQSGGAPPLVAALQADGVPVTTVALSGRAYRQERREVAALCASFGADLVHTHGARIDVVDSGVARRLGLPTVTTVHGFTGGGWKNRLYEWLQRRAFRRISTVVAVSHAQRTALERDGVGRGHLTVIANAWDGVRPTLDRAAARQALGIPADRFVIGWVGRIGREKGLDVLLDALVREASPQVTVAVIGDGRERHAAQRRAEQLGIASRVSWHGIVPDAGQLFRAFDCFALSSRSEGVPIVLFEAMAADVPIVATSVGGVPDVVTTAEAMLVPPENPTALAAGIAAVRRDTSAAAARARAARQRLERDFSASAWVERYEAVYQAALARRPA